MSGVEAGSSGARRAVVLLADRDGGLAEAVRRALALRPEMALELCGEPEGICAAAVASGAAAVLLAVSEPVPEGLAPLRRLAADPGTRGLPVAVLARRVSPAGRAEIFSAGAADCFGELPEAGELCARLWTLARVTLAERERDQARRELADARQPGRPPESATGGIASRARLDEFLDGEWRRARRNGSHLSLVLVEAAAGPGPDPGAGVEREVPDLAGALRGALRRGGDLLARCGEGRFAAVLPEVGAGGAATVAEALRRAAGAVAPAVSLRLGVATVRPQENPTAGPQALLTEAHAALG